MATQLLTDDGELARWFEQSDLPRTYLVKTYGALHRQKLVALQRSGRVRIPAADGIGRGVTYEGVRIKKMDGAKRLQRDAVDKQDMAVPGGSKLNRRVGTDRDVRGPVSSWWEVTVKDGKNREVRNIMEHLGLGVGKLQRTRFGPYKLGWLEVGDVLKVQFSARSLQS